jgi:hypothetical protein
LFSSTVLYVCVCERESVGLRLSFTCIGFFFFSCDTTSGVETEKCGKKGDGERGHLAPASVSLLLLTLFFLFSFDVSRVSHSHALFFVCFLGFASMRAEAVRYNIVH